MNYKKSDLVMLLALCIASSGFFQKKAEAAQVDPQVSPLQKASGSAIGEKCASSGDGKICLALKYVVYKDATNTPVLSASGAAENLKAINDVWGQCNIKFQIDKFEPVAPEAVGLSYDPANTEELTGIRTQFQDNSTLLLVTTGDWNRSGTLGNTGANAWTSLPGDFPFGVVLEQNVSTFSNIIAHEIGHYLNLLHGQDADNLMYPIIYPSSMALGSDQCELAQATAQSSWGKMLR